MNNQTMCLFIQHACLFICSGVQLLIVSSRINIPSHLSSIWSSLHVCHCTVMPVLLLLPSNSCCVMQCSCIGITWQLRLLSKLNIMTPVLSVATTHRCGFLQLLCPKTANELRDNRKERNGRMVYFHSSGMCFTLYSSLFFFIFTVIAIIRLALSQAAVALQEASWKEVYPMDFYSNQSQGPWTPNHPNNQPVRPARRQTQVSRGGR